MAQKGMTEGFVQGTARLYAADGEREEFIVAVNYQLWHKSAAMGEAGGWKGQFFIDRTVNTLADYVLEMEDGRRLKIMIEGQGSYLWRPGQTSYVYTFLIAEPTQ